MSNFFKKIFGKKNKEEVPNNLEQQNNLNEHGINNENQNIIQPEQPITFNQNMNIENQSVNPLGFQPTTSTDNIQNNLNSQEYNLNPQPTEFNNQLTETQAPAINLTAQPELNVIPETQQIQNQIPTQQPVMTSNEINNVGTPQPIIFNPEQQVGQQSQHGTLNVIPTLGPTPNPVDPNQNNGNNQNM